MGTDKGILLDLLNAIAKALVSCLKLIDSLYNIMISKPFSYVYVRLA